MCNVSVYQVPQISPWTDVNPTYILQVFIVLSFKKALYVIYPILQSKNSRFYLNMSYSFHFFKKV